MSECSQNNPQERTKHHRKCRSTGGTNRKENVSFVPRNKHEAYHLLFANSTPEQIARILSDFWIDPDYMLIAVPRATYSEVKDG